MTKEINYHPLGYGNEHGEIRFGHIIKGTKFGSYLRSGSDKAHYMNFKSTGDVKQGQRNSTNFYAPGSFTINCGEDIEGAKSKDGGKLANPYAYNLLAQHGDIRLSAPLGTIKLDSNQKIVIKSPDIEINSSVSTKIFSEGQLDTIGKGIMNVYGGLMDFADGPTALLGSKSGTKKTAKEGNLSSLLEDMMRTAPASIEAAANELKKAGIPGKLKDLANSDAISELTGEMAGVAARMEGQLSLFETDAKAMSEKLDGFFKKNL